ncbi:DUF1707 domain-containing protein [Corynebacterium qintianiae]|uniref:DUF1707 domain-containing protein n=1 Tax=Corynebacterium qintianiae TaxID=2709392 RepID=A0A7T0KMT7_9CORY|nr:DUF1707 domain-containing protein [Corynebacterium qintianiae]QPK83555.1 DUF1707 domain-containing protein [Corynebacterium qintianiae]
MDNEPGIRIGDPERARAFDRLTELFTNGYLDVAEFDRRTAQAANANYRNDLTELFADLPDHEVEPLGSARSDVKHVPDADAELDRVLARGKKVQAADAVIWSATMVLFFLGLFVFHFNYFWVVFPIAGIASMAVRGVFGLEDEDEQIFDELTAAEKKKRAERLRLAAQRRRELGQ